ncbi:ABC transporter permease [Microtetraspora niveoalba]|uniref:ABC transporter permease n=1 Tax=Microtetraspora niveoalba TaxID=46175 RepID=UPI001C3F19BC|nr:ABC transporter permease [Microtetraspora niveoalba]
MAALLSPVAPGGQTRTAPPPSGRSGGVGRHWPFLLIVPALLVLLAVFVYPVAHTFVGAFTTPKPGTENFTWFFGSPANVAVLTRTFSTALWATLICLALAYPYAYLMTVASPRARAALLLIVMLPFWTSLMVRTFAWLVLLQDTGVVNGFLGLFGLGPVGLVRSQAGVLIGMVQILMPFMVLPLYSVMSGIDRRLLTAAQSLGARPVVALLRIFVPLSLPGVAAGSTMVFITSLGFYVTPALLGSPSEALISQFMYTQVSGMLMWGRGGAMAVVLFATTLLLTGLLGLAMRAGRRTRAGAR